MSRSLPNLVLLLTARLKALLTVLLVLGQEQELELELEQELGLGLGPMQEARVGKQTTLATGYKATMAVAAWAACWVVVQ